jgi:integrase/recombinase XerD
VTWVDAIDQWAEHARDQLAETTRRRYAVSLAQTLPYLEKLNVDEIDGRVVAEMIADRNRGSKRTAATVRRDLTAVSRVLEFAEAMGWREGNPTLSKRRILKERRDPIVLPEPADVEAVIAAASAQFGALIRAAWLTGCRQNELVTVKWKAFSGPQRTLEVIGKGNKRRVLSLSAAASAHIAAVPRALGSDLIFCKQDGEPFSQAASDFTHLRRQVMAKAKRAGGSVARFRFHDLRHLFAVEALRSGSLSIYELSKHLGHSSIKTTEIYLEHLTPEQEALAKARGHKRSHMARAAVGKALL